MVTTGDGTGPHAWYALHTRARHEKAIAARLGEQSMEIYLPLHRRRKKWRNGVHAEVDFPLLPCYLFARVPPEARAHLLNTSGVLGFAGMGAVPDEAILRLRAAVERKAVPHPQPEGGDRVRIVAGPLAGTEGVLETNETGRSVVLAFEAMHRAISVAVGEQEIERIEQRQA